MSQRMGTAALCSVSRHSDQGREGGWACRDFQAGLPHCSLLPGFLLSVCSEVREGTHYDVKLRQNGTNPFKGSAPILGLRPPLPSPPRPYSHFLILLWNSLGSSFESHTLVETPLESARNSVLALTPQPGASSAVSGGFDHKMRGPRGSSRLFLPQPQYSTHSEARPRIHTIQVGSRLPNVSHQEPTK